ncbi:MAG: hypothetical protein UH625_05585 [Muribaculaceae bacterium]|nr:hypothetical protein [Muribaculaceae bacterium]
MQIDYNKFTESELRVIIEAARTINFAFGTQFPSMKEQMALLIEDFQFRAINQIVIQSHNAIRSKYIARGIDPDAPDFVPDSLEK